MGYSIDQFINPDGVDKEFICSICQDVMQNPIMSEKCEHIYCKPCLQRWMSNSATCPIDRVPIAELRPPIRAYMNMYSQLQIQCKYDGCTKVASLIDIDQHYKSCGHNPDAIKPCNGSCGASLKNRQIPSHNCIEYLKEEMKQLRAKHRKALNAKECKIVELNEQIMFKDDKIRLLEVQAGGGSTSNASKAPVAAPAKVGPKRMRLADMTPAAAETETTTTSSPSDDGEIMTYFYTLLEH